MRIKQSIDSALYVNLWGLLTVKNSSLVYQKFDIHVHAHNLPEHDRHSLNHATKGPHPAFVRKLTLVT
jgi:hypothetical protein